MKGTPLLVLGCMPHPDPLKPGQWEGGVNVNLCKIDKNKLITKNDV